MRGIVNVSLAAKCSMPLMMYFDTDACGIGPEISTLPKNNLLSETIHFMALSGRICVALILKHQLKNVISLLT